MNIIYKWIPYDIWNKDTYELWLKELAYSGLQVQKIGKYWGKFKQTESQTIEYRLCFSPKHLNKSMLTDYNWKEVKTPSDFAIFQSDSAQPSDGLYKSPDLQIEDLVHRRNAYKRNAFWLFALILFVLGILLWPRKYYVLHLLTQDYAIWGFYLLVQFTCLNREIKGYKSVKLLEESLLTDVQTPYTKHTKINLFNFFYLSLLCCIFIMFFVEMKTIGNENIPLPLEDIALPIMQLSNLEDHSILQRNPDHVEYDFLNCYEKHWSPLAFRVYESDEDGILNTQENINKSPYLETEFYELTFKWMREPLVQDLIQRYQDKITVPYKDIVRQDVDGLDGLYILDESYNKELIGIKDTRVMYVYYNGSATLDDVVKEIARKIVY